jgi:hypothetical protein
MTYSGYNGVYIHVDFVKVLVMRKSLQDTV